MGFFELLFGKKNLNPLNAHINASKMFSKEDLGNHYVILSEKPLVIIPEKYRYEHTLNMGASGKGKTVLLRTMYFQDIYSGSGVIFVDPKDDQFPFMLQAATAAGRIPQIHSIRFRGTQSETWNPIFGKNPIEIANRLHVALFADDPEANSFYKNVAGSMLRNIFSLLMGYGKPLTLKDIYYAVLYPQIMEKVVNDFEKSPDLYRQAHEIKQDFVEGRSDDAKKLTKGLRDKLQTFVDSPWAHLTNTYCPDIIIEDAICRGDILHFGVASDILGKECYQPLLRMLLADVKQAAGHRYSQTSKKPCFFYCDEFGDVASEDFMDAIKKYRSAGIGFLIGFQSLADLERRGEPFKKDAVINCATKFFFNLPEPNVADYVSKLIGTFADRAVVTQSYNDQGEVKGQAEKLDMRSFKVGPDMIKNLDRGHCIAVMPYHTGKEYPVYSFKAYYPDPKNYPEADWEHYLAYTEKIPKDESIGLNLHKWVEPIVLSSEARKNNSPENATRSKEKPKRFKPKKIAVQDADDAPSITDLLKGKRDNDAE